MTILAISDRKYNPVPKQKRIKLKPKAWASLVAEVWERENKHCQVCRKYLNRDQVAAHHRISRGAGGHDTLENLICLCSKCHEAIHKGN